MTEEIQEEFTPPRFDKIAVVAALLMLVAVQIVAAQRIGWVLEYPLDDVYIHLAMASEIARGGYGVNSGEFASAASSALYPVLLTPFPDSGLQRLLPLFWNVLGLGLCAWLWGRALIWAGYRGLAGWVLAIGVPVFTGSVSTSYVGMEHTLHAAASIAIVFGLARVLVEDRLNALLFVGILFSPLFRFEGLALCTLAIFVLAFRGRYFAAILGGVVAFVPIGLFVYYLLSLGLDPLPNSVQAKLVSNDDRYFLPEQDVWYIDCEPVKVRRNCDPDTDRGGLVVCKSGANGRKPGNRYVWRCGQRRRRRGACLYNL